jgi:hypothetical protein
MSGEVHDLRVAVGNHGPAVWSGAAAALVVRARRADRGADGLVRLCFHVRANDNGSARRCAARCAVARRSCVRRSLRLCCCSCLRQ